jgi:hypothetical protein
MITSTWYQQFVKLQDNPAPTTWICGMNVCALIQDSSIMSVKRTIIIDGGSRPKKIVILVKFWYEVLIWTSDHHLCFVCRNGFPDSHTQPQLIRGTSPSTQKLTDEVRLTWIKLKTSRLISDQKIALWCCWFQWYTEEWGCVGGEWWAGSWVSLFGGNRRTYGFFNLRLKNRGRRGTLFYQRLYPVVVPLCYKSHYVPTDPMTPLLIQSFWQIVPDDDFENIQFKWQDFLSLLYIHC